MNHYARKKETAGTRRLLFALVVAAPIVSLAVLVCISAGRGNSTEGGTQAPSRTVASAPTTLSAEQAQAKSEVQARLDRYMTPHVDTVEAQHKLDSLQKGLKHQIPLTARTPKDSLLGKSKAVYIMKDESIEPIMARPELMSEADVVRTTYDNGIFLTMGFKTDACPLDYSQLVANDNAIRDDGVHTELPVLVKIHGYEGMGMGPGYDYFPATGGKNYRGAFLEWTDDDARYCLRAPLKDQTVPLSRLIEVANSMY